MERESPGWTREEFERRLRELGRLYHIHHPYHSMMSAGKLNREQIQGWVANRFYYQVNIPLKDAQLLARCPDREIRRTWVQRILDQDGRGCDDGGIEAWLRLGEACGLARRVLLGHERLLPGVRYAVDAYVSFVRDATWQEGVCSSLTELFAPTIHQQRVEGWPTLYPWVEAEGLDYFRRRVKEAPQGVEHALAVTLDHFSTRAAQERAIAVVRFKLDVLWAMADAMYMAYVLHMPPYANLQIDR